MASKVIMPKQGLQMTEGIILEWFKKEGDTVKEGDPLFAMETDKLAIDIDSQETGTLLKIIKGEGETVPITDTIAIIGEPGEDISGMMDAVLNASDNTVEEKIDSNISGPNVGDLEHSNKLVSNKFSKGRVFVTPRARMRAEERSVNIDLIDGTGPEGLIVERDILSYNPAVFSATPLAKRKAEISGIDISSAIGSGPRGKIYTRDLETSNKDIVIALTGARKIISERMRLSLDTAAQATHRVEVDMSEAVRLRDTLKNSNIKISYNDIILKTVAEALKLLPGINSSLRGENIIKFGKVNIGMAVAVENGLLVPVIKDVNKKSLMQINLETQTLGEKARSGQLKPTDMEGATFTVSNLGMFGLDSFTAIINTPESGILAVGAVKEKAVVIDKQIVIRPMCNLTLTYDHRIIDGAPAAEFLMLIKAILENPYRLI